MLSVKETNENTDLLVSLRVLNQIGASIISELTVPEMIDTVYFNVNQLMDAYSFAIGIYNPVSERIDYISAREHMKKLPAFSAWAHDKHRFSGWIFEHKQEILMNDYEVECRKYLPVIVKPLQGMDPGSCMYVPLIINKEIAGILSVRSPLKNAYSLQAMEFLKTLGVFISRAIENSRSGPVRDTSQTRMPVNYHLNPLSARELEVLGLLAKGYVNKVIAAELFISDSTVKTHTLNIYQKLEAANRTESIIKAKSYGLIR